MKFKYTFFVFLLFLFVTVSGTIRGQSIDFSQASFTIADGNWSDPNIWNDGQVPNGNTDVVIPSGSNVYVDVEGSVSGEIVSLCKNLMVQKSAVLQLGHNTVGFLKALEISGSIICDGTISQGRQIPSTSGDGIIYQNNARIYMTLSDATTYISGKGYFHPGGIYISSAVGEKNLTVNHYNVVVNNNFIVDSENRISVLIDHFSFVNIGQTLAISGGIYQESSAQVMSDLQIDGIVSANDVSLFTRNDNSGEGSSIVVGYEGSLWVKSSINQGAAYQSGSSGFSLEVQSGGLFRCGSGVRSPETVAADDANFSFSNQGEIRPHYSQTLTSVTQIQTIIDQYKPTQNNNLDRLNDIFGASHIDGRYHFTDRPYLLEGLDYFREFGSTAIKTSLSAINGAMNANYHFNHTWPAFDQLVDVANHKMMDSLFSRNHIKTHAFWATTGRVDKGFWKDGPDFNHEIFLDEENQFYELTKYLLQEYGNTDKTFIYQNWEGDWMLRGQGVSWENNPSLIPDDVDWVTAGMARYFRARQRGTERARKEFPNATAKILNAIELNKLWYKTPSGAFSMMESNIPAVASDVIPYCRLDLSSWSSYDGLIKTAEKPFPTFLWNGLEMINYFTVSTEQIQNGIPVQIGEIGFNENTGYFGEYQIRSFYDRVGGVALGLGVQQVFLWNLYCVLGDAGGLQRGVEYDTVVLYDALKGKWLLEPDGTWGWAAGFFMEQFAKESTSTGIENLREDVKLVPSVTDEASLSIKMPYLKANIRMYDMNGRMVTNRAYSAGENIFIGSLLPGYYVICVDTPEGMVCLKFAKK
ncbi:hypothetical protein [Marinilabilia rubra]|uniref:Uncharacterized protein n=1 Tax=Marinilabilia rubra TaxID=2162893 RepID=A0A2U2B7C4_9BACT|nr:hypothetical protein [Marinilabilia rubra]PWD98955.1 hypothetical protein DDZ16_13240 [Marinilabilia rubra]